MITFFKSVLLALVLAPLCQAATYTWDNESGDNEWTHELNWVNNSGLPKLGDTVVFNDLATGLCRVETNTHVLGVVVTNNSGLVELTIPADYTLKTGYQQSYATRSTNQVLMSGGGSFAPTGSVIVSYAGSSGGYNYSTLTVSNLAFQTEQLASLYVGANDDNSGAVSGRLDLANASISWNQHPDMLAVKGDLYLGMEQGRADLMLPPTLTNLTVQGSTFWFGGYNILGESTIHLGENPALMTICSSNSMRLNNAYFVYTQNGNTVTGLPSQVELVIGAPGKPGSFYCGYTYNSPTVMRLGNFKSFRAWLSLLYIGKDDNSSSIISELDLSETSVTNLEGSITAGSVNIPVIAIGGTRGYATGILKLPATITNITCNSFELGNVTALSGPPNSVIHLGTNTHPITFTVSNNLVIGYAQFQTVNALGITNNAFPAGSILRVGAPQNRATVGQDLQKRRIRQAFSEKG